MKVVTVFLALVGLVACSNISLKQALKKSNKNLLERQKFLYEIVYRVEDPLQFEEFIKLGDKFILDKSEYIIFDNDMQNFYDAYTDGSILSKDKFFAAIVPKHAKQADGLFKIFYNAKNWEVFQRNVAWARMHCNKGMFVNALNLAVRLRSDLKGLTLPGLNEIFPQQFFDSKFIRAAEQFNIDNWNLYEHEYQNNTINLKDYKEWQWWLRMGLSRRWYSEDKSTYSNGTKTFFMPVDYTRDIEFLNKYSALSYLLEDVGLNTYWHDFNMMYNSGIDKASNGKKKNRRSEYLFHNVQQVLRRVYMESLSLRYGKIPQFSFLNAIENGYKSQLVDNNGIAFSYRENNYKIKGFKGVGEELKIFNFFPNLDKIIKKGYFVPKTQKALDFRQTIDLRQPDAVKYIVDIIQGNDETFGDLFKNWDEETFMYLTNNDRDEVVPNVLLNFETIMRDPLFYELYERTSSVFQKFKSYLKPYTRKELISPDITIKNVSVSELTTYFDLVDFDVTNLLPDKMTFVDGQFVWNKTLLARQTRLNHKPFDFNLTIEAGKPNKVAIRIFLGPKYNEFGRLIPLNENRQNFMEIDSFVQNLKLGINEVKRSSKDFSWTTEDATTYTELYQEVVQALAGNLSLPRSASKSQCGFPDRLVLPRGWAEGMPMQFFYHVTPFTSAYKDDSSDSCGMGSGVPYPDDVSLGYPFDRSIDEAEFFVPNVYFQDTKITHV